MTVSADYPQFSAHRKAKNKNNYKNQNNNPKKNISRKES